MSDGFPGSPLTLIKELRLSINQILKQPSSTERSAFFEKTVIWNEVWKHHYDPETMRQSMKCKHTSSPIRFVGKVMLSSFWGSQGPVYCDSLMISKYHFEMLKHKVRPAVKRQRHGLLSIRVSWPMISFKNWSGRSISSPMQSKLYSVWFLTAWTIRRRTTWKKIFKQRESEESGATVGSVSTKRIIRQVD